MWKVFGISMLLLAGQAYGSQQVGCKARQQAVADQLVFAKAHNNADQIAGLEQALRNIEAHCTDDGLFKEQQQQVAKLKEQVNERLLELQNARVSGKPDKIAKKQAKLEEAQAKLLAAQSELDALSKLIKP
ncbi:hypothetical protein WH06_04360 [Aeromonas salmonicida subsp. salmonicida]|uniref:DUF1090 domain-containing protein n=2 Tax=Aeromonas salmonicida subsp. salmonicida TaxID=29491 RepID=A4SJS3_AERS4|nr:DUF1090 domain-containing protein [Aeromonas salmonicida]ABO89145.1 conserved hypothetical protein [Aeromonas salmonicida subsp. salmonicida A449]ATD40191.1 hypothetical protein BHG40_21365 [Aeromonas salmonicida subsp. masoucida]KHE98797.1 hypothetical protein NX85_15590 [Aeromonas salmonicida subsp. salmonicida]KHE98978.1 hypothetical protein NV17_05610 [Aeromonas salmonicida subsp. salmonicida]KIX25944.1 hypothetical protein TM02_05605 [Aeromonas salmonicida subsp. salmonicida]